jgi:hypothetical protein
MRSLDEKAPIDFIQLHYQIIVDPDEARLMDPAFSDGSLPSVHTHL